MEKKKERLENGAEVVKEKAAAIFGGPS